MRHYRLGVLKYLNTKPLICHLEQNPRPDVTLIWGVPSQLVDALRAGELDTGLVSAITCLGDDRLAVIARSGIACRGPVDSIRLFTRVPPEQIRRVALDTSSRAAAALTRILMAERYGVQPEFFRHPPDLAAMMERADACLLIGDSALRAQHAEPWREYAAHSLDLGEVWHELTGLPFIFAVWAAPRQADTAGLSALLAEARDAGRAQVDGIADEAAPRLGIPAEVCRNYLRDRIVFDLGPEEWAGLRRYQELARKHGLVPPDAPPFVVKEEI